MKKRLMLIALLLAAVLLLSACSSATENNNTQTNNTAVGQVAPMNNTAANNAAANAAAAAKEEEDKLLTSSLYDANGNRIYAGATPVPIDPVDLPTATPKPELTFTYDWYTASKLGISFRSAVGYDDTAADLYPVNLPFIHHRNKGTVFNCFHCTAQKTACRNDAGNQ